MSSNHRDAGVAAFRAGDWSGAVEHLRQAVEQHPADAAACGYLGIAYGQLGMTKEAAATLRHATIHAPTSASLHHNLGVALEAVGDPAGARESYRQAVSLDPGRGQSREALARLEGSAPGSPAPNPAPAARSNMPLAPPLPPTAVAQPLPPAPPEVPATPGAIVARARPVDPERLATTPSRVLTTGLRALIAASALALAGLLVYVFWFAWGAYQVGQPVAQGPGARPRQNDPKLLTGTPVANLTPLPSGFGIQVCDPVPTSADPGTAAFGSGCGRWLQFTLAGHGELGKTPMWSSARYVTRELGSTHLRVTLKKAPRLAAMPGRHPRRRGRNQREPAAL